MSADVRQRLSPQHLDLALTVAPLLNLLNGEKRDRLHRAFIGSAVNFGITAMPDREGRLPVSPKEAVSELHRAVLDLALRVGLSRRDLAEAYNEHAESGTFANGGIGEAVERALALLAIFYARDLAAGER